MEYYIYTNWQAKDKETNIIHKWSCGHCRMGLGKHKNADKGENGVWIGAFKEIKQAKDFSEKYLIDKKLIECKNCLK